MPSVAAGCLGCAIRPILTGKAAGGEVCERRAPHIDFHTPLFSHAECETNYASHTGPPRVRRYVGRLSSPKGLFIECPINVRPDPLAKTPAMMGP